MKRSSVVLTTRVKCYSFRISFKAFIIFENKRYTDWPSLKKDLSEGIRVSKSTSALQNELMNLTQNSDKSAKDFADIIKEKLKELSDIIATQYDQDNVRDSFKIEHEKIAIRAFREGLRSPLKERIINFEAKSLDELTRKAIEEEPFVQVLKASTETSDNIESRKRTNFENKNENGKYWDRRNFSFNDRNFFDRNQNQQNPFFKRNWRNRFDGNDRRNNYEFYNGNRRPFTRNGPQPRQNNGIQNTDIQGPNNSYNRFSNRDSEMKTCLRCNKKGHLSDTCYVRLNKTDAQMENDERNMLAKLKQVSFLETPKNWQPPMNTRKVE